MFLLLFRWLKVPCVCEGELKDLGFVGKFRYIIILDAIYLLLYYMFIYGLLLSQ